MRTDTKLSLECAFMESTVLYALPLHVQYTSTVLTSEEETMSTERLIYDGKRGLAVGKDTLKPFISQIASDGRPSSKDGVPSEDAIRAFRARDREITFKDRSKYRERKLLSLWKVL